MILVIMCIIFLPKPLLLLSLQKPFTHSMSHRVLNNLTWMDLRKSQSADMVMHNSLHHREVHMAEDVNFITDFDASAQGWNASNVRLLAYCSDLAYGTRETIVQRLDNWQLHFVDFLNSGNTQAFLADGANLAIVCYRGTEPTNAFDWATDAQAQQVRGPFGMVHAGFNNALQLVWSRVSSFVQQSVTAGKRV